MRQLMVIRRQSLDAMRDVVRQRTSLHRYRPGGSVRLEERDLLPSSLQVPNEAPTLHVPAARLEKAASDIENAIKVHEYLGAIPENQARDGRLWAYITHAIFPEYCRDRWPLPVNDEKAAGSVLSHWFVDEASGLAALRRNAIARLWWAAHVTYAPWKRSEEFAFLACDDEYAFTRTLLSNQDIYLATLERSFGSSQRVLVSLLAVLRADPGKRATSPFVKACAKELNLISRFREISVLPASELVPLFETVAARLRA
jgi:hypothetical protein